MFIPSLVVVMDFQNLGGFNQEPIALKPAWTLMIGHFLVDKLCARVQNVFFV
jgi:hypothetical protein